MGFKQGFQQLEELDLSANHIQGPLPGEIGSLKSLCLLNIRQNRLSQIPPEISKLTRLLDLNLSMNQIAAVPVELASLTQLNTLDLSDNVLEMLPEEIGRQAAVLAGSERTAKPLQQLKQRLAADLQLMPGCRLGCWTYAITGCRRCRRS